MDFSATNQIQGWFEIYERTTDLDSSVVCFALYLVLVEKDVTPRDLSRNLFNGFYLVIKTPLTFFVCTSLLYKLELFGSKMFMKFLKVFLVMGL